MWIVKIKKILRFAGVFAVIFAMVFPFPWASPIYEVPQAEAAAYKRVFLTSSNAGYTWVVPADFTPARNVIEVIGGGGVDICTNTDGCGGNTLLQVKPAGIAHSAILPYLAGTLSLEAIPPVRRLRFTAMRISTGF